MEKTCKALKVQAQLLIGIMILLIILFETGIMPVGIFCGDDPDMQSLVFWITTFMELLTIILIPLALRLFRFSKVRNELLEQGAPALQKWGVLRINMLLAPAVINIIWYYFTGYNVAFAYLAIILLISLAFVWPTQRRCEEEVADNKK